MQSAKRADALTIARIGWLSLRSLSKRLSEGLVALSGRAFGALRARGLFRMVFFGVMLLIFYWVIGLKVSIVWPFLDGMT